MASGSRTGELVGQKLGKYELLSLIAVGGTAEIYLARISGASGFEKYLVVKCLLDHLADDPEFVRMFLDEARVGAQLDHSNIVQTLELGQHDGRYFLVMEYLAGMSLAQLARKTQERGINRGLIPPNLILGMVGQTCNGLFYAHNKKTQNVSLNLVHRDISPQNLVVSYEGILKVVDFGIAKSDIRDSQTKTGTIKGKFAYMSPEQCLAKEVDHRTDIFALGTLCHELLTGRRLFKRQSTYDTYQAIIGGDVPTPSSINPQLDANVDKMVMKALAYKREDRYQSAQEFSDGVLTLLHSRSGSGSPTDIARFFDDYFQDDLKAHANQMREFIVGRVKPVVSDSSWDSELKEDDDDSPKRLAKGRAATVPISAETQPAPVPTRPPARTAPPRTAPPRTAPPRTAPPRQSPPLPSILPASPDMDIDAAEDDEATRVEFNPADKVAAFHQSETGETRAISPNAVSSAMGNPQRQPPAPPPKRQTRKPGVSEAKKTAHFDRQADPDDVKATTEFPGQPTAQIRATSNFQSQPSPLAQTQKPNPTQLGMAAPATPEGPPVPVAARAQTTPLPAPMPLHAAVGLPPVPSSAPIDLSGPSSDSMPRAMQAMPQLPSSQFTAAVPRLSPPTIASLDDATPPWHHALVFLAFLTLGYGLVAVIKSVL